jgi:hypothetical protein
MPRKSRDGKCAPANGKAIQTKESLAQRRKGATWSAFLAQSSVRADPSIPLGQDTRRMNGALPWPFTRFDKPGTGFDTSGGRPGPVDSRRFVAQWLPCASSASQARLVFHRWPDTDQGFRLARDW